MVFLKHLQGVQHCLDLRHFVGAEEVGFAEGGENGEERLGTADFLAKIFKGVRQRVADGKAEVTQAKRVQKRRHLMAHTNGTVL